MTAPTSFDPVPREVIERLVDTKFRRQYSPKIGRHVFVLKKQLAKDLFESYKWVFGHTDIGWTVKYPHHLARLMIKLGVWVDPE